jgi:two-component system cell cycle sensor histidine kinase/response regulator CckA
MARRQESEISPQLLSDGALTRALLDSVQDAVYVKDRALRYVRCNRALVQLLGRPHDELLGATDAELFPELDAAEIQEVDLLVLSGQPHRAVFRRRIAGEERIIDTTKTPIHDDQGQVIGLLGVSRDISERNRAQELHEQLLHSQKLESIGLLAGGVAHDFNNILTAIFGNAELAMAELELAGLPPGPVLSHLQQIERSAERASGLTRQLLAFSRRQVSNPQLLDFDQTIRELEKMLHRLVTEDIQLSTQLDAGCTVHLDPGQLEQVVVNLVVNAGDAMPSGGQLRVHTRVREVGESESLGELQAGDYAELIVEDSGQGIATDVQDRVFDPFFTTKAPGKGTGLGLSTVYGIVRQSGGHIRLESEAGQGTRVHVLFPALDVDLGKQAAIREKPRVEGGTETILICEDDAAVRELTQHMLSSAGYEVFAARSPGEALALCATHRNDLRLLVTDVVMPDLSGPELANAIEGICPGIRTLYVSGYPDARLEQHGMTTNDIDFLSKPFSRNQLLEVVKSILSRAN